MRCRLQELDVGSGEVKWAENLQRGYFAQDNAHEFEHDISLFDWITQWQPTGSPGQLLRATLGFNPAIADTSEKAGRGLAHPSVCALLGALQKKPLAGLFRCRRQLVARGGIDPSME